MVLPLCDAYCITGDIKYRLIIEETIAFAERELKDKTGGYYCALDADSEGEEGKFYTWTWDEWIEALDENDVVAEQYFGVKREGNWEGTNILHVATSIDELAAGHKLTEQEIRARINTAKHKLRAVRDKRERPITDDKSLLSWNALMNMALSRAGVALKDEKYLLRADEHMRWMLEHFELDGALQHAWKNGIAKIPAKLDDLAYLVQALLQLGSATGENNWILKADEQMQLIINGFSHEGGFFYYTPLGQQDIPVRKVDLYDGATPSANALMAHNLWLCGMCMERSEWIAQAGLMLNNMSDTAARYSYSFGYWVILIQRHARGMKTVVISGKDAAVERKEVQKNYLPQAFLLTLEKEISDLPILEKKYFADKMYTFVCSEQACLSPVSTVDEALRLINQNMNIA